MAVPKRKKSKSRKSMRQRSHHRPMAAAQICPQCGEAKLPHRVCPSCGFYRGRQVVSVTTEA